MAEIIQIHPKNPEPRKIEKVVSALQAGATIIYPTDTIYAIGCDTFNSKAVENVARVKGIKSEKANFSIMCHDLSHISEYARPVDQAVFRMLKRCLPGPYTFILEASPKLPRIFTQKKKTIGIRVPDNRICLELIKALGRPIISSSLHADDVIQEYPTDPEEIAELFGNRVDIIIDGGMGNNIPSTVIDCSTGNPEVIREGAGPLDKIFT